ncbi:hypothetical protein CH330_08840 [candidate division WOR-3 bacterium JGI_Cruoil_03_51_56]|uniref:4Fe-4S ferredoxin-type domain-containing protein n=1 Tax=candidate division WOR-3 bacterium JGI_Cruoil_03_51_56 TaxID=1973747 RepID=A0A235BS00_UNCW3|nr:MAG: hypothetical protein CH330_08840 [candidate division WOR-3 bacterium JGI_Cruoil_03_51_56]
MEYPDKTLIRQIETLSGQGISDCYQCGRCTSGCPVVDEMDLNPRQTILLLQLGKAEEVLGSNGIWLCASCMVCGTRCPCEVDYARIAEACRAIVLRAKNSKVDPDSIKDENIEEIPQQAFVASFRKFAG